jgi:hypothetical protein
MAGAWKEVRVFISSTFRDVQAERDHLVRFVFPRQGLLALERAIDHGTAAFMIQASLESLERLAARGDWPGLKEARATLARSATP